MILLNFMFYFVNLGCKDVQMGNVLENHKICRFIIIRFYLFFLKMGMYSKC